MLAEETEEPVPSCLRRHGVGRGCGSALRVLAGDETLTTLPWELVKQWGGGRGEVGERKEKEMEGGDGLKKRGAAKLTQPLARLH